MHLNISKLQLSFIGFSLCFLGLCNRIIAVRRENGNTVISNWIYGYYGKVYLAKPTVQLVEITRDKKNVWILKTWKKPNFGLAIIFQLLNEKAFSEKAKFGSYK